MFLGFISVAFTLISVSEPRATECSIDQCKLPFCRCATNDIPGGYNSKTIPQMVVIAFDDFINWKNWKMYQRLFPPNGSRKNPNGCTIAATFFVSHLVTDYCMVRKLHARGMEIGVHGVTHRSPHTWWEKAPMEELEVEMVGQREIIAHLAKIPLEDLQGWRSPFIQPGGDNQFLALYKNGFKYDATMMQKFPNTVGKNVTWPFTLDYSFDATCFIAPCPKDFYPGIWIVPVISILGNFEKETCAYLDSCLHFTTNQQKARDLLWKNFLIRYEGDRSPLYLNLHYTWLVKDYNLAALDEFILKLLSMNDVFFVTMSEVLEWVKRPQPLSNIHYYTPWQCDKREAMHATNITCMITPEHRYLWGAKNSSTNQFGNDGHENYYDFSLAMFSYLTVLVICLVFVFRFKMFKCLVGRYEKTQFIR